MSDPSAGSSFDAAALADTITRVLATSGGSALVVEALGRIPGAVVIAPRSGMFKSNPARVQLGAWRYEAGSAGRLAAAHVVGGVVLGEELLPAAAAGVHVARALGQQVSDFGPQVVPEVEAVMEGLRRSVD